MELIGVIPAKDEAGTIQDTIEQVREHANELADSVGIIVVSSSHDGTDAAAREMGATVVRDGGTGLGEAMFRGLKAAAERDPDLVFSIDADLQFQPDELDRLVAAADDADLVLGSRFLDDGLEYDMSLSHRFGNHALTTIVNRATGLELTDAQTGYRVMTPEVIRELRMMGRHTYVQETILDAHRNGFSITEVPVRSEPRDEGSSRVVSSIQEYALRTLPVILHRSGHATMLLQRLSLLGGITAMAGLGVAGWNADIAGIILSMVLLLVSVQLSFYAMELDAEHP